jgi:butyrate kinase
MLKLFMVYSQQCVSEQHSKLISRFETVVLTGGMEKIQQSTNMINREKVSLTNAIVRDTHRELNNCNTKNG